MGTNVAQIYDEHVRMLSAAQRLELLALIVSELTADHVIVKDRPRHCLSELRGLGKEIWEGVDAQEYVNQLRDEWNERPFQANPWDEPRFSKQPLSDQERT